MVVLDATVVNIALPSAQNALHFSDGNRQWIVTAYSLTFGSLLLLFGRFGDLFGRKRTLIIGLVAFGVVSAIGGAAQSFGMLVTARAFQGAAGALLAPSALGLLTTTFTQPRERGIAFGIYGAIAGAGGAVGLLLGGVLTEYLSWRWCLYVNVAIANTASRITPTISDPSVSQSVQPRGSACENPKTIRNRPSETVTAPGTSSRGRSAGTWLVSRTIAANTAGIAMTTFTYRHQRHDRYSVNTPPSSSPTAPPAPAIAP